MVSVARKHPDLSGLDEPWTLDELERLCFHTEHAAVPAQLREPASAWSEDTLRLVYRLLAGEVHVQMIEGPREEGWAGGGKLLISGATARWLAALFAAHEARHILSLPHMTKAWDHGVIDIDAGEGHKHVTVAEYSMRPLGFVLRGLESWAYEASGVGLERDPGLRRAVARVVRRVLNIAAYDYLQFESERELRDEHGAVIGYHFEWRVPTPAEARALSERKFSSSTNSESLVACLVPLHEQQPDYQEERGFMSFRDRSIVDADGSAHAYVEVDYGNLTRMKGWRRLNRWWGWTGLPALVHRFARKAALYYYRETLEGMRRQTERILSAQQKHDLLANFDTLFRDAFTPLNPD